MKEKILHFYEKHETKLEVGFFLGGFAFDALMLTNIEDISTIAQEIVYFSIIGFILYKDFLANAGFPYEPKGLWGKIWQYRQLALHFFLGNLLNLYSLFFLKSASLFSSIIFVVAMLGIVVANETALVKKGEINSKIGLYILCIFCFFSFIIPVILGFVGRVPFALAVLATLGTLILIYRFLHKKITDTNYLFRQLLAPGIFVIFFFVLFYAIGWIPPVPIAAKKMGVYHNIVKSNGQYLLHYEKTWWKFWQNSDKEFKSAPGDKINFFVSIFSPARFEDSVYLVWSHKDPKRGWQETDRLPMKVAGGREGGYRGFMTKQNYTDGDWRISVQTTDGLEVGRLYFEVIKTEAAERNFHIDVY